MVSSESVNEQLKKVGFNINAFSNKAELRELPNIILPDEEIFECVNGYYEGGFSLLVATNIRVLLVDKKPLNFLTVEDLRFDMINQIDYSHRLLGAQISISAGLKNLVFRSYNKERLRKLINHVQHCIADAKKKQSQSQQGQNQHLEQINQQLQTYLLAQFQNQQLLNQRLQEAISMGKRPSADSLPEVVKPGPELSDYLYAQSLLKQYEQHHDLDPGAEVVQPVASAPAQVVPVESHEAPSIKEHLSELYAAGRKEIFAKHQARQNKELTEAEPETDDQQLQLPIEASRVFEVNPLRIAVSKLPAVLKNRRKFGRPNNFGAASAAIPPTTSQP